MSWAEVKYALNSTLGTDEFMPLNKVIINTKVIEPDSNTELWTPDLKYSELSGMQSTEKEIAKFRMFLKGKIYIKVSTTLYKTATSTPYTTVLKWYVNGTLKSQETIHSFTRSQTATGQVYDTTSARLTVNDDDIISVKFLTTDAEVYRTCRCVFDNIVVLGKVVDTVAFDE